MKVNIRIFDCLDDIWIAHRGQLTDDDWARAIGGNFRKPTISELRRISRNTRLNKAELTGRACTIDKIVLLYAGLINLFGGEIVRKDIQKCIKNEPDQETRLILLALMIAKTSPADIKTQAEQFLGLLVKQNKE